VVSCRHGLIFWPKQSSGLASEIAGRFRAETVMRQFIARQTAQSKTGAKGAG
jgi:hypothetical protein